MFNPYKAAKEQRDIVIFFRPLPEGLHGLYVFREQPLFIINSLANQIEQRCATTEELGHYFLGHRGNYFIDNDYSEQIRIGKQEYDAKIWAADRLIDTNRLIKLISQDHQFTPYDIADMFWVTLDVLFFKLQLLVNLGYLNNFFMPDITRYTDR